MVFPIAIGVLTGASWMGLQAELPDPALIRDLGLSAMLLLGLTCLMISLQRRLTAGVLGRHVLPGCVWMLWMAMATAASMWHCGRTAGDAVAARLPSSLDQRSVWVEATVRGLPTRHERGLRFEITRAQAFSEDRSAPLALMPQDGVVQWYAHGGADSLPELRPGQRLGFTAKLRQPSGPLNPGGFDVEAWMLERGLHFSATVQSGRRHQGVEMLGQDQDFLVWIDRLRMHIRDLIDQALADSPHRHVLSALVIGDQRAITGEQWAVFQRTGTSHLMSISGLHVTMLAALAGWIGAGTWRMLCRLGVPLALWVPVPSVRALAAVSGAMGYALLAGFAIPAQRTAWMVLVVAIAAIAGIRAHRWAVLSWALIVVLLLQPMAVLSVGFWLSFIAVGLLLSLPSHDEPPSARPAGIWRRAAGVLSHAAKAQMAITFGLLPLGLLLFQQVSVVGPIANAIAIPVVSFVVTPLAMAGVVISSVTGLPEVLVAAEQVQSALMQFLLGLSSWAIAVVDSPSPGVWRAAVATAGVVLAIADLPWGRWRHWRHLGWLALLLLWSPPIPEVADGQMEISVIDVGQGSSMLIRTRSHHLIFDTGPSMGDTDAGMRYLMPTLRRLGIREIDRLMVSHLDQDHSGGVASLLALSRVGAILTSDPTGLKELLDTASIAAASESSPYGKPAPRPPIAACRAGMTWTWDGVRFQVMHPSADAADRLRRARRTPLKVDGVANDKLRNDLSCVLRVEDANGGSLLLTGDISLRAEQHIVGKFVGLLDPEDETALDMAGVRLQSQVLMAPHHGSRTSTGPLLLEAVAPSLVVIQAGHRNRYGHPHAEVLDRLAARSQLMDVARTDLQGALTIRWVSGQPVVSDFFQEHRRYWHGHRGSRPTDADAQEHALAPAPMLRPRKVSVP